MDDDAMIRPALPPIRSIVHDALLTVLITCAVLLFAQRGDLDYRGSLPLTLGAAAVALWLLGWWRQSPGVVTAGITLAALAGVCVLSWWRREMRWELAPLPPLLGIVAWAMLQRSPRVGVMAYVIAMGYACWIGAMQHSGCVRPHPIGSALIGAAAIFMLSLGFWPRLLPPPWTIALFLWIGCTLFLLASRLDAIAALILAVIALSCLIGSFFGPPRWRWPLRTLGAGIVLAVVFDC